MRKLDDIIPPSRRKEADGSGPLSPAPLRSNKGRIPYASLFVVLVVIAGSVGALFYFSDAKITVTPQSVSAAVQNSFTATRSSGELPFETVTVQKIATQSAASTGTKTVNTAASGTITIYNTQTKAQKLIANTRFATSSGLIFRIRDAVTIPAGSASKPGSIDAKVTADKAGEAYNIGPSSFTVPGLAGTPQATQVYGRSTAAMTGGASGTIPVVDSATEAQAVSALTSALTPELEAAIKAQVPEGYALLSGASQTSFKTLTPTPSEATGMVDIRVEGEITATIFPKAALAKAIAASVTGLSYQGESMDLSSLDGLALSLPTTSSDGETLSFTLSGTAALVYSIDKDRLTAAVAGKTRPAANVALSSYPEIQKATLVLRPFWKRLFPADPADIRVEVAAPGV